MQKQPLVPRKLKAFFPQMADADLITNITTITLVFAFR